jgi:hypothetical protein
MFFICSNLGFAPPSVKYIPTFRKIIFAAQYRETIVEYDVPDFGGRRDTSLRTGGVYRFTKEKGGLEGPP